MTPMPDPPQADPQEELRRFRALVGVLEVLARSSRSYEDVVRAVHDQARRLVPAHLTLLARREGEGTWNCHVLEGEDAYECTLPAHPDSLLEGAWRGPHLFIPDLDEHARRFPGRVRRLRNDDRPHTRAWMGVPLHVRGHAVGVLSLQSYDAHAFSDLDLAFLDLFAKHVSIALENAALHARLREHARTDALTALYNRRAFTDLAGHAIGRAKREARPLCLVVLDVRHFKRFNDEFGHAAGDAVLRAVAVALRESVRAQDAVFRLGGDEFALLLDADEAGARLVLSRVESALAGLRVGGAALGVALNAGVASFLEGDVLDTWLGRADAHMYEAKRREQLVLNG